MPRYRTSSRLTVWVFAALLLAKGAVPFFATAAAQLYGKGVADIWPIYGVALPAAPAVAFDPVANRNITRVQNVDRIATTGIEGALQTSGWLGAGLDLAASITYTDSKIRENSGFVTVPGDTIGK